MSPQQMIEHLEQAVLVSLENRKQKMLYPEEHLEKWQDSLYNQKMPKDFTAPFLPQDGSSSELKHKNLEAAKQSFIDNLKRFVVYYKENPQAEA
jgi:oxepin-CoA hydrolase/3-oxo-5,6-dehydrosuberyl-CoA semialdehyde dehydrogenase